MEPYEQGTSSTDKEDVDDKVVVDGDLRISMGSMNLNNPKVYSDTSIFICHVFFHD